ncbi:MAG TPA: hypothetical protein VJJ98_00510, partial [Sedimentisphaerales bacterium]|nr:hypothetical protein [Sedimentisphaerales bacterium]
PKAAPWILVPSQLSARDHIHCNNTRPICSAEISISRPFYKSFTDPVAAVGVLTLKVSRIDAIIAAVPFWRCCMAKVHIFEPGKSGGRLPDR